MPPLLSIQGLSHWFGGHRVVRELDLELPVGAIYGLIGPHGAGKTTTFKLISGLYAPSSGSIRFNGQEIAGQQPFRIVRLGIARTVQNLGIFNGLSVLDNLRVAQGYGCRSGVCRSILRLPAAGPGAAVPPELLEILRLMGLADRRQDLAGNLACGELRRLEFARALATRPKLILLDEPATDMTAREVDDLLGLIKRVRESFGLTVLLIEHHMKVILGTCDQVKVLEAGATIAEGRPERVGKLPRVRAAYLGASPLP